jgi:hypothetical protein
MKMSSTGLASILKETVAVWLMRGDGRSGREQLGRFWQNGRRVKEWARASKPVIVHRRRVSSSDVDVQAAPAGTWGVGVWKNMRTPANGFVGGGVELAQAGKERRAEGLGRVPVVVFQDEYAVWDPSVGPCMASGSEAIRAA